MICDWYLDHFDRLEVYANAWKPFVDKTGHRKVFLCLSRSLKDRGLIAERSPELAEYYQAVRGWKKGDSWSTSDIRSVANLYQNVSRPSTTSMEFNFRNLKNCVVPATACLWIHFVLLFSNESRERLWITLDLLNHVNLWHFIHINFFPCCSSSVKRTNVSLTVKYNLFVVT